MVEIRHSFSSMAEWKQFRESFTRIAAVNTSVLADVQRLGCEEPLTGKLYKPDEIHIKPQNLHESISAGGLNSRKRALILHFLNEILVREWQDRSNLRILSADGLSRLALILRGRYPYFYGGEYLPSEEARRIFFPLPHLDLHKIDLPDNRFDLFISGDVFEHLPFLHKALTEIYRVLKPGGVLVSSFPFAQNREATLVRASISKDGELVHHEAPEFHGNPVDPKGGSLVFQLPGWDILQTLKAIGFEDAYFTIHASSRYGIASDGRPGAFILTATKAASDKRPSKRPENFLNRKSLPEKLCALIALPRSGTTLITSVFSVHSKFVAVFEPWNSTPEFEKLAPTVDAISKQVRLPDLDGKILFVKETASRLVYIANLDKLLASVPDYVPKHVFFAIRSPAQTFLSEVSRRKEWWNADVSVNRETFENWVAKSRVALRMIIQFVQQHSGTVIALGSFAARPEKVLEQLGRQIGFAVEPAQLEYEKHIDVKIVRGDRNIGTTPAPINATKVNFRDEDLAIIQPLLTDAGEKKWFEAFQSFYDLVEKSGGLLPISDLPDDLRSVLVSG